MKAKSIRGLAVAAILVAAIGCDADAERFPVTGMVTLDEQPVANGQITFSPLSGTKGPTAGAPIIDGQYAILAERGPMPGKFRVEITASRPTQATKQTLNIATGQMETTSEYESIIPQRYNVESELTREVSADGPNEFDFDLKSE